MCGQILRSASHWSAGIRYTETSIQDAYREMITQAEHFIYIEVLYVDPAPTAHLRFSLSNNMYKIIHHQTSASCTCTLYLRAICKTVLKEKHSCIASTFYLCNKFVDVFRWIEHSGVFCLLQNQFFVTIMKHDVVENKLAEALHDRILRAHRSVQLLTLVFCRLTPVYACTSTSI